MREVMDALKSRGLEANGKIGCSNYFKLFDLEQALTLSEAKLKREHSKILRAIHPDKFVNSDADTQDRFLALASFINDVHELLRHPYRRAKYLASIKLGVTEEELDSKLNQLQMDDEFLQRVMNLREMVDLERDGHALGKLAAELEDELNVIMHQMSRDFQDNNTSALVEQLGKLKFLGNLHVKLAERTEGYSTF